MRTCSRPLASLGRRLLASLTAPSVQTRSMSFASGFSMPTPKTLDSIMPLAKLRGLPPDALIKEWTDFHIGRGHVSGAMSAVLYEKIKARAATCPLFVVPVRKEAGFITILAQAQMPHLLFTGLEDFKVRGAQASPYMTVTHYTDLVPSTGIVLIRGDVVFTSKLSDKEARHLMRDLHSFYVDDQRYKLVEEFNRESANFEFRDVLKALQIPFM